MNIPLPSINPVRRIDTNVDRRQPQGNSVRRQVGSHKPPTLKQKPEKDQGKSGVREA